VLIFKSSFDRMMNAMEGKGSTIADLLDESRRNANRFVDI
jgi:hypothetical protein